MKKVLIVDDRFSDFCRAIHGYKYYDKELLQDCHREAESKQTYGNRTEVELTYETHRIYLERTANPEYFDITPQFLAAGGSGVQLLVLGDPACSLDTNVFWNLNRTYSRNLAEKIFNMDRALSVIEKINPDVLLVDMGFHAPMKPEVIEEYVFQRKQKSANYFAIQPRCRNGYLDFPVSISEAFEYTLGYGYGSLSSSGGVLLARELKRLGQPFSFWTGDLHHGGDGLVRAYTLDLLSEQDVREVVASDDEISLRKEQPPARNNTGSIIVCGKHYLLSEKKKIIKSEHLNHLLKVIEIAEEYQKAG